MNTITKTNTNNTQLLTTAKYKNLTFEVFYFTRESGHTDIEVCDKFGTLFEVSLNKDAEVIELFKQSWYYCQQTRMPGRVFLNLTTGAMHSLLKVKR